jgi:hypothetical protein
MLGLARRRELGRRRFAVLFGRNCPRTVRHDGSLVGMASSSSRFIVITVGSHIVPLVVCLGVSPSCRVCLVVPADRASCRASLCAKRSARIAAGVSAGVGRRTAHPGPTAAAVLSAQRKTPWRQLEAVVVLGELALDGRVRPVRGVLPAVLAAKGGGPESAVVPA